MPPRNMRGLATNVAQTINNQAPNKGERGHTPWPGEPREMKPGERWDNTYDNAALVSVKTEWDKEWEFNIFQGKGQKPTKGKAPAHFITPVYELPTPEGGVARRNALLRHLTASALGLDYRLSPDPEDALYGLLILARRYSGITPKV